MERVVIIGAGGHGREVAGILKHQATHNGEVEPLGYIDDNRERHGQVLDGLPVLGDWSWFEGVDRHEVTVLCAVGTTPAARKLVQRAKALGLSFARAVSPVAHISPHAVLEEGVMIFAHAIVHTGARIGGYTSLNVAVTVSHDVSTGAFCNINPGAHVAGNVTIGEGCYVGMGSNIIQGVVVGEWSVVGAGAVVIRSLPPNVTAVGVPARVIKTRESGWHAH